MMLFRCMLCPTWRRIGSSIIKPIVRKQTTTSKFSNVEQSLQKNVLVFEYKDRLLPLLGALGLMQFIVFDAIAYWSFHLFGTVTARPEHLTSDSTMMERAATMLPTNRFRYTTNIVVVLVSAAIFAASIIYPARCIRRLYLLKDGSSIGVVTYALWSSARKFTAPLSHVSAQTSLRGVGVFHKIKIKNHRLSHLVNKKEGTFYDNSLYETVIALKRF